MVLAAAQDCPEALPEGDCCRFLLKSPVTLCMLRRMLWCGHSPAGRDQQQEALGRLFQAPGKNKDGGEGEGEDEEEERHKALPEWWPPPGAPTAGAGTH